MAKGIKTTKEEIVDYWRGKIREEELNFDWGDALDVCWNCGQERSKGIEKCHIIAVSLKGKDQAKNFVLLCRSCHNQAPNCSSEDIMWDWIKANKTTTGFYETYFQEKATREYQRLYKKDFQEELLNLMERKNYEIEDLLIHIRNFYKTPKFTIHFCQGMTDSTRAGIFKMLLEYLKHRPIKKN
jgi:hypothetical protein